MLISNKEKFIFIHIKKSAGTSITKTLSQYDDRNLYLKVLNTKLLTRIKPFRLLNPLTHHAYAYKVRDYLGKNEYQKHFSFAFVRNPFDWQVSNYFFIKQSRLHTRYNEVKDLSFNEYLDWTKKNNRIHLQSDFITSNNNQKDIIIDYVGKLENIKNDFNYVLKQIGLGSNTNLKFTNKSKRSQDFKKYYDNYSINFIEENYSTDLENFSYCY